MSISTAEAKLVTRSFARQYPGAYALSYRFRDTVDELYDRRSPEIDPKAKGGYISVLLDGIIGGRGDPLMAVYWSDIDRRYSECGLDVRAEEVFALHCETLAPRSELTRELADVGRVAFNDVCLLRSRPMTSADIQAIAYLIAERFEDRHLPQLTLPRFNEIRRQEHPSPPVLAPTFRPPVTAMPPAVAPLHSAAAFSTPLRRPSQP